MYRYFTRSRKSVWISFFAGLLIAWAACDIPKPTPVSEAGGDSSGIARILEAFEGGESDVVVEAAGTVQRILSDDTYFPRHQRFILSITSTHTVLVAHNIDLAPRAPVEVGKRVRFRGEYEWNERGGVIHWTHHDPEGRRPGGWIEVDGKRFE